MTDAGFKKKEKKRTALYIPEKAVNTQNIHAFWLLGWLGFST